MPQPTVRARTQHDKDLKRRKLMSAAMELFVERGYKTPTVGMITERAGTSVGTFYLYFSGKCEIYKAFQREGIKLLSTMIFQGLDARCGSARERLAAAAGGYLRFYREFPEYYGFIALNNLAGQDDLRESKSRIGRIVDTTTLAILQRVEAVIIQGIETGEFRPMDTWKTACALWGMIDGYILMEERNNTRVIGMALDDLITHGLETAFMGMVNPSTGEKGDSENEATA